MNRTLLNSLAREMTRYDSGDARRIQHFFKVHAFSRLIGEQEGLDEGTLFILETAAYVHDIGIKRAEENYHSSAGPYQEELGPAEAEKMLTALGFEGDVIRRVMYLVGHHHTYTNIDGMDYQILVEADFLVNLFENGNSPESIRSAKERIFRTKTGTALCEEMFGI